MNPVNFRALLCAVCILCLNQGRLLAQHVVEASANSNCAGVINTRGVSALSIDEISNLAEELSLQNSFGGMSLQPFDDDDRPRRGKEIEIGFILARSSDLGGTPVGLIIWSDKNISFYFEKSSESTIAVESSDLKDCHVLATFTLTEKGEILRDNKMIARAR